HRRPAHQARLPRPPVHVHLAAVAVHPRRTPHRLRRVLPPGRVGPAGAHPVPPPRPPGVPDPPPPPPRQPPARQPRSHAPPEQHRRPVDVPRPRHHRLVHQQHRHRRPRPADPPPRHLRIGVRPQRIGPQPIAQQLHITRLQQLAPVRPP